MLFLFDMDGVLIDSESAWKPYQNNFSTNLFGEEIYKKIGSTIGISIDDIYKKAEMFGFKLNREKYYEIYDRQAEIIYNEAKQTKGIQEFILYLKNKKIKVGLVSSSRKKWIDIVLKKLNIINEFDLVISLNERKDLKSKPNPDGYLEAMKVLHSFPQETIILEDSNSGILSAEASGAFTIGYKEHLLANYNQIEADCYAENLNEVRIIINKFLNKY